MAKIRRAGKKNFAKRNTLGKRLANVEKSLRAGRETKIARLSGEANISSTINSTKLITIFPEIPNNGNLTVGVNDASARDGNEIRLKRLIVKSWVQYAPDDTNNRVPRNEANVMCRHMIIRQKDQMSSQGLIAGTNFVENELLESGGFTQANEFRNIMSPINRNVFTVKSDRKRRITNAVDTADANADADANPHNFVVFNKTLTFGKMGKKLTFSKDTGVVQPIQFPWIMAAGYCNTNGSAAPFNAAKIFYDVTAYYTDA